VKPIPAWVSVVGLAALLAFFLVGHGCHRGDEDHELSVTPISAGEPPE
jgi:hypothetical protein